MQIVSSLSPMETILFSGKKEKKNQQLVIRWISSESGKG